MLNPMSGLTCFPCDEFLSNKRETFYLYQCSICLHKTPYCLRCNKTMDALLNGIFFKCLFCKVLSKICHRESVSPEHDTINRILFKANQNEQNINMDSEIKNLFHPSLNVLNNTPYKNMFNSCNILQTETVAGNSESNILDHRLPQNLNVNFNRPEVFQTPRNTSRIDKNNTLIFSPDHHSYTPNKSNHSEHFISLKNLAYGLSTPRGSSRTKNILPQTTREAEGITVEEFENKLNLHQPCDNIPGNYSLLSSKSNISKVLQNAKQNSHGNNSLINKVAGRENNFAIGKVSEFAGYNKTERRSVSKSPLSLRKSKNRNEKNILSESMFTPSSKILLNNFNESNIHHQPNFGMTSYLSEIKQVNDYTTLESSKFGYGLSNR